MAEGQALSPRTDALDVIVELLGALDGETGVPRRREFYDRLCEALLPRGVDGARRPAALRRRSRSSSCRSAATASTPDLLAERLRHARGDADRAGRALRGPRGRGHAASSSAGCPSATRDLGGVDDAHLHAGVGRRPLARRDLRRPRRHPLRAHRRRSATPCGRSARPPRSPRACASRRASRAAPACSRRASTSRASSTSASCSACSASRSCSARSTR